MGPINCNFISWCPTHTLIIWQPEKPLRDLRNSKGSTELSATSMEILVSGIDQKCFWTSCFYTAHQSTCQGTRYSNVNDSLLPVPTLPVQATITHRLVIPLLKQPSGGQQILFSHLWLCSITQKSTALFLLAKWSQKLLHAASLSSARRTTALWGNLSPL